MAWTCHPKRLWWKVRLLCPRVLRAGQEGLGLKDRLYLVGGAQSGLPGEEGLQFGEQAS